MKPSEYFKSMKNDNELVQSNNHSYNKFSYQTACQNEIALQWPEVWLSKAMSEKTNIDNVLKIYIKNNSKSYHQS